MAYGDETSMTALHDYEDWLDTLDARLRVLDGSLTSTLGVGYVVPLDKLASESLVLQAAGAFWASLQETDEQLPHPLPRRYLLRRFHELAFGGHPRVSFEHFAQDFLRQYPEVRAEELLSWRGTPLSERHGQGRRWWRRILPSRWFT